MATKFKRGRSWYLQWSESGKRKRKSLGPVTISDAETARLAKEFELRTGHQVFSSSPLMGDLAEEYIRWHSNAHPASTYRVKQIIEQHILPAFRYISIDQLTPMQVESWQGDRLKKVARSTVAKETRALKAMLNKAVAWRLIGFNPIEGANIPRDSRDKPPRWYTMEELQGIYGQSKYSPVWQFMVNTGLRRSEALHLKWEHIEDGALHVVSEREARTKSGKWRKIPLSVNAKLALDDLRGGEYILPVVTGPSLSRAFRQDAAEIGGSIHCLRHTFGTHMAMKGVPIQVLKELMGHSTVKVTERYMHVATAHLDSAIQGFSL